MKHIQRLFFMATFVVIVHFNIKAQQKKNVVFIMADDFNFWLKKIGYYPQVKTPNLDALADKGVLFSNAHCSSPVSNPSRNALWSGYRPSTTGIDNNSGGYVRDKASFNNITSFSQYFTEQGYYTYAGGKIWHPGSMGNKETDPNNWSALYTGGTGSPGGSYSKWTVPSKSNYSWSGGTFDLHSKANDTKLADHMANKIKNYSKSASKDKPFFMAIGFFRPHMPWNCHKDFWDMFDRSQITKPQGYKASDLNDHNASTQNIHADIVKAGKWEEAIHGYLANLAYADYNVGIVLDAIKNSEHANNTIICFMGDHGWHLGEKERWGKYALYDMAHWTSLVIYDPSAEGNGKVCKKTVSLQDLYPTLVELCGLDPASHMEGRSIAPLLYEPEKEDWSWPILMSYSGKNIIKTNQYRLVNDGNKSQLYKVDEDPYEWNNLYGKSGYAQVTSMLRNQIDSIVDHGKYLKNNNFKAPAGVPIAYITSPMNGSVYSNTASISIVVKATDPDGTIAKVEFYHKGKLLKSDNSAPYSFSWNNAPLGINTITAKAYDNKGNITETVPVNITVTAPGENVPPAISVVSPSKGKVFGEGAAITAEFTAKDVDGNVESVQLFVDDKLVGTDKRAPFVFSGIETGLSLGNHSLYGIAIDNSGNSTKSEIVTFSIKESSSVSDIADLSASVENCPSVKLQWSDVNGETAYRIRRKIPTDAVYINLADVDVTSYIDGTAEEGQTYIYVVRPLVDGVAVSNSNLVEVAVSDCTIDPEPEIPTDIKDLTAIVDNCSEVSLTWTDVSGESGYRVRRKIEGETAYTNVGDVPADATSYTDVSISPEVAYIYQVRPLVDGKAVTVSNNPIVTVPSCVQKITQTVSLKEGWNLVTLIVVNEDMSVKEIFPNAKIVKNFNHFWDEKNDSFLNSLQEIEAGEGYLVYNSKEETLTFVSVPVQVSGEIILKKGWNLVGVSADVIAESLKDDVSVIKDFESYYSPDNDLNSLEELEKGKAYFMFKK